MSAGNVIKDRFGKLSEQPNAHSFDLDQSLICHHRFAANGEHHEYDSVGGWIIRQNAETRMSRFNFESLSAMH